MFTNIRGFRATCAGQLATFHDGVGTTALVRTLDTGLMQLWQGYAEHAGPA